MVNTFTVLVTKTTTTKVGLVSATGVESTFQEAMPSTGMGPAEALAILET
jgi:hypothetical protein